MDGKGGGRGEGRGSRERGWKTRGKERLNFPTSPVYVYCMVQCNCIA